MNKRLVFFFLALSLCCFAFAQKAEFVYVNGNIITIQSSGHRAEAVAIANGRILAVGTNKEILQLKSATTKTINLKGRTLVPGFNDAHLHPSPIYPFESLHANLDLTPGSVKTIIVVNLSDY